jgi:hypothetical protein
MRFAEPFCSSSTSFVIPSHDHAAACALRLLTSQQMTKRPQEGPCLIKQAQKSFWNCYVRFLSLLSLDEQIL